ncbi:hypothetical protein LTS08_000393 [Lithohypha guttulata]|nr:hypothetical protein LTS08_000393 [Lithohypha guttulata]
MTGLAKKMVYIGAPFEWTPKGAFFLKLADPPRQAMAVKLFCDILNTVIQYQLKLGDHTDEELMSPVENTTLPVHAQYFGISPHLAVPEPLIDIDQDSEDSSDGSSSTGIPCAHWTPRCGDISILSSEVAAAISNITECILYREHDSRRVKIMNGNTQAALEKLVRMEPLLGHLARHRSGAASRVDYNLLSFSCPLSGTGVRYQMLTPPHRDRVMVHPTLTDTLEQALLGEERIYNSKTGKQELVERLKDLASSADKHTKPSKIWEGFELPTIGNPDNAVPRTPSSGNSSLPSETARSRSSIPAAQPSRFMASQEQARLREWSKNIDLEADPATIPEEPIELEEVEDQGITKRRVEDSESEDDETNNTAIGLTTSRRLVVADSDDESGPVSTKVGKRTKDTPLQSLQEQRIQAIRVDRTNRVRETQDPTPVVRLRPNTNPYVGADAFFEGVPRDGEEATEVMNTPQQLQKGTPVKSPPVQFRGGFGLDGANDEEPAPLQDSKDSPHLGPASSVTPIFREPDQGMGTKARPNQYMPSHNFDPSAYGSPSRGPKTTQNRDFRNIATHQDKRQTARSKRGRSQSRPHPSHHGGRSGSQPVPSHPGIIHSQAHKQRENALIEISTMETAATSNNPPPGLTIRAEPPAYMNEQSNLLDSPLEEIQRPSLKPVYYDTMYQNEESSFSASSSSGSLRPHGIQYVPQTTITRPDVPSMRNNMLHSLLAAKGRGYTTPTKPLSRERIAEEDEISTRKFYNTMNLQAPKDRKNRATNAETNVQRQARIARARDELRQEASTASRSKQQSQQRPDSAVTPPDPMTKKGLQAAKINSQMAALHIDAVQANARQQTTNQLLHLLRPIIEAARCFTGHINLEFQLGQLFVSPTSRIDTRKIYEIDKWKSIFEGSNSTADVHFTNMLTSDGADIDGMLEVKIKKCKIWNKDNPGPSQSIIEFRCLDNLSQPFQIVLDARGKYTVNKGDSTVSKIAIHCPGKVWDTCAVLSGTAELNDITPEFEAEIQDFVSTVYMKAGKKAIVHFRPPLSNSLTVLDVVLKRTSLHDCQVPGEEALQLKITEVKTLSTKAHISDKRLHVSVEERHDILANTSQVFYEVAVVNKDIEEAFQENKQLEVGEMTLATANNMLTHERINTMLQAALKLVDKVDWIGGKNYGTLRYKQDVDAKQRQEMAGTIPPTVHNPTMLRPATIGRSIAAPRTAMGHGSTIGTNRTTAVQPIHGIRAGTEAEIWQDPEGNLFYIGLGGAKIPVLRDDPDSTGRDILPDDSASQIARAPQRAPNRRMSNYDKPNNFW